MSTHQEDASRWGQGLGEMVLNGIAGGRTARIDTQLIENGGDMRSDRGQAHHQSLGDLGIG